MCPALNTLFPLATLAAGFLFFSLISFAISFRLKAQPAKKNIKDVAFGMLGFSMLVSFINVLATIIVYCLQVLGKVF